MAPGPDINLITGGNGAGKTTLLEGIYLAGRGRTFRHVDAGPMIRRGAEDATVVVSLIDERSGKTLTLGVRRDRRNIACRLNGDSVHRRSELAEALPVQWVGSQPQLLLELGPEVRRRFLDMAVFHVERGYVRVLGEFQRILRQRNAAIRSGASPDQIRVWDGSLADAAESIDRQRGAVLNVLIPRMSDLFCAWVPGLAITHRYRRGWRGDKPLVEQLASRTEGDLRVGYTTLGPQRAELEFLSEGVAAEKVLSRGQQKLLVLALNLALLDTLIDANGRAPVFLIDDLAAELDPANRGRVIDAIGARPVQAFLTTIDPGMLPVPGGLTTVFHVEQGALCRRPEV